MARPYDPREGAGLLSQYGLDLNETDLKEQDLRQRQRQSLELVNNVGYRDPRVQGMAQTGGLIAAALGNRGFRPSDDEQRRIATAKAAQEGLQKWIADNPTAKAEERTERYQEVLAESAFKNGLPDIGSQVLTQLTDKRAANARRAGELEKLGYENTYAKETMKSRIAKEKIEAGKAGIIEVYEYGSQDPNSSVAGWYNPEDGSVSMADGRKLAMGEWKDTRPLESQILIERERAKRAGAGGKGYDPNSNEAREVRREIYGAMNLQDNYGEVLDLVKEAGEAVGPVTGQYGKLLSMTNKTVGFLENLSTLVTPGGKMRELTMESTEPGKWGGRKPRTYNINKASERQEWAKNNTDLIMKWVPGLREKGKYADRYIALMTELAYAKAMASEGGASRSLSDRDFENAFVTIGGSLSDPQALAEILLADADRLHKRVGNRLSLYRPEVIEGVISEGGFERLATGREKLDAYRSGDAFKLKDEPGPASGALSPEEQAELDALRKRFGKTGQ